MDTVYLIDSIRCKFVTNQKYHTLKHVENVADTAVWLANLYGADIVKAKLAALLHDISAIMTPQEMYTVAKLHNLKIYDAEEKFHFLLHQRISKIIAQESFGISDPDILNAIECHTTLKKNASIYDKIVFIADKLAWDQQGLPPYYNLVKSKVESSLDDACYAFIAYQFDNDLMLMPHQWIIDAYEDLKKF